MINIITLGWALGEETSLLGVVWRGPSTNYECDTSSSLQRTATERGSANGTLFFEPLLHRYLDLGRKCAALAFCETISAALPHALMVSISLGSTIERRS